MCPTQQTDLFPDPKSVRSEAMPQEAASTRSSEPTKSDQAKPASKKTPKARARKRTIPSGESVWMTVHEVAQYFSVSVPTIWRWAKDNPAFPEGYLISPGTRRWLRKDLERFSANLRGETA